jgi:hypothetical protein
MDTKDVWRLVEQARADTGGGDADAVAGRMTALLAQREPTEIVAFAQPLWDLLVASYRADLWAAAYVINGGSSDDGFDYFRGWLLAQGQAVYDQALTDPDSLADLPAVLAAAEEGEELEGEAILSVAWDAHLQATHKELPADAFTISYPQLDPDWDFDFNDEVEMRRRLPRLTALYYEDQRED